MKLVTYKKAVCGTAKNRIVTLQKDESKGGSNFYYVAIQYDYHTAQVFDNEDKAYECFYGMVDQMSLTIIDEVTENVNV